MSPQLPVYNLSDLPDSADVPKGRHRAKLMSCTKKKSREQHIPMLEWKWKIISGKSAKLTILSWTMLDDNPRSLATFKQHMLALGRKNKSGGNTDDLLGRVVTLVVDRREYTDKKGNERTASNIIAVLPKDAPLKVSGEEEIEGAEDTGDEDEGTEDETGDETEDTGDEDEPEEKPAKKKKPVESEDEDEPQFDPALVKAAAKDWNAMDGAERKEQATAAGLTGKFMKRDWDDLTDEEKSTMYELQSKPAKPAKPAKKKKQSEEDEDDLPF